MHYNHFKMNKGYITIIGFVLFLIGFLSILFSLVGLQLSFLKPITALGAGAAFVIYLIFLFGGIILMYVSKLQSEEE